MKSMWMEFLRGTSTGLCGLGAQVARFRVSGGDHPGPDPALCAPAAKSHLHCGDPREETGGYGGYEAGLGDWGEKRQDPEASYLSPIQIKLSLYF